MCSKVSFSSKIDLIWSYPSQNMGLFQPRKVQLQAKKIKSSLEAKKMKLKGRFFGENVSFY
jgi:hypothetical protein